MRRWVFAGAALVVLGCLYRTGTVQAGTAQIAVAVLALALAAGIGYGALVGAGHARERRAWDDYQDLRARLPVARRAWLTALGVSARRLALPGLLVAGALVLLWWRGQR
jgi:hypothetical protein